MTDTKHTPGPWVSEQYENSMGNEGISIVAPDGTVIADNEPFYPQELDPDNAHLIAAAPELLEALEMADAALSGANMDMSAVERKARAAIAKAKGEK